MEVAGPTTGNWSDRTVLVTGAAGLLGRRVVADLSATNARVIGIDLAWRRADGFDAPGSGEMIGADVRDTDTMRQTIGDFGVDTVIHLAAQTLVGPALEKPAETFSHNIEGSWSVLEACRTSGRVKAIVLASSDKAYGDWLGREYREDMALRATHPYDTSKAASELVARSYASTYGMPISITRCGNLYGGGDLNWSRIVPGTIRSIIEGHRPVIRSDGTPIRDYLHVSDAASGVLLLVNGIHNRPELRGEAFNLAGGNQLSAVEMVRRILLLMESPLEPEILGLDLREIPEQRLSSLRASRTLGWKPLTSIDDGLLEAITWYQDYLATPIS